MRYFVLGAYGQKNMGDESLALVFIEQLRKRGHQVTINSHRPKETQKEYQVKAVFTYPWKDPLEKLKVLWWCDTVVYGGGTILSQIPKMLFFMTLGNITAKLMGKKVAYIGVGVGNLKKSKASQLLVKLALTFADLITLRDKESFKQLKAINAHRKALVTADPVLLLQPRNTFKAPWENSKKPVIGISFRYMVPEKSYKKALQSITKLIKYLVEEHSVRIVIFPIQYQIKYSKKDTWQYDSQTAKLFHEACKKKLEEKNHAKIIHVEKECSPYQIQGIIGQLDLYVSAPLHSLMFAAVKGTPMIALDYASNSNCKIEQFMESIGQKNYYIASYQKCEFETLKTYCEDSLKNKRTRQKEIAAHIANLKKKAMTNFDLLEKATT
jgi:polysaccharide pyruvyl transferase WcaK-like protein